MEISTFLLLFEYLYPKSSMWNSRYFGGACCFAQVGGAWGAHRGVAFGVIVRLLICEEMLERLEEAGVKATVEGESAMLCLSNKSDDCLSAFVLVWANETSRGTQDW